MVLAPQGLRVQMFDSGVDVKIILITHDWVYHTQECSAQNQGQKKSET